MKKFSFHTAEGLAIVYAVNAEAAIIKLQHGNYRLEKQTEKVDLSIEGEAGHIYSFPTTDQHF